MKVLVATDDLTFNVDLVKSYLQRGLEVHVGPVNLFLQQQRFDIVHCHWPEELVGWSLPPDRRRIDKVMAALDWARETATLICSVHNVLPHGDVNGNPVTLEYYNAFLQRMDIISHFSNSSIVAIKETYPQIPAERHFLHGMNLFSNVAGLSEGRATARAHFGLTDEFVVGTFGQLRTVEEVNLIRAALDRVRAPKPKILFASRPPSWGRSKAISALKRRALRRWQSRHDAIVLTGYLSDTETARIFDAVDAMIVPRSGRHLNSGLMPLAMSFGTPLVAPDYGVFREYLTGSQNMLYAPNDPVALARAIEGLAEKDKPMVRASNSEIARDWGWNNIVEKILHDLDRLPGRNSPA